MSRAGSDTLRSPERSAKQITENLSMTGSYCITKQTALFNWVFLFFSARDVSVWPPSQGLQRRRTAARVCLKGLPQRCCVLKT